MKTIAFLAVSVGFSLAACDPASTDPNDSSNTGSTGTTGGVDGGTTGDSSGGTTDTTGGTTGSANTTGGTTGSANTTGGVDGGTTSTTSVIAGSGSTCSSYAPVSGEMCAGYYCNVTAADVAAELVPGAGPCSALPADFVCGGSLSTRTATCSRQVKSNPLNVFDDDATLRGKVEVCVFEDATIKSTVSSACLSCYLDAAQCASDNCLTVCLAGDSPECDTCRFDAGCLQALYDCAGLPTPF